MKRQKARLKQKLPTARQGNDSLCRMHALNTILLSFDCEDTPNEEDHSQSQRRQRRRRKRNKNQHNHHHLLTQSSFYKLCDAFDAKHHCSSGSLPSRDFFLVGTPNDANDNDKEPADSKHGKAKPPTTLFEFILEHRLGCGTGHIPLVPAISTLDAQTIVRFGVTRTIVYDMEHCWVMRLLDGQWYHLDSLNWSGPQPVRLGKDGSLPKGYGYVFLKEETCWGTLPPRMCHIQKAERLLLPLVCLELLKRSDDARNKRNVDSNNGCNVDPL